MICTFVVPVYFKRFFFPTDVTHKGIDMSRVAGNPVFRVSNRSDTNRAVLLDDGNFGFRKKRVCTVYVANQRR